MADHLVDKIKSRWLPGAKAARLGVRIKTVRVTTGAILFNTNASVTVTWPTPFKDANYTVIATVEEATAGLGITVEHVVSKAAASCVVRVKNDATSGTVTGTLHVVAISD